jgi:hypothetical protein
MGVALGILRVDGGCFEGSLDTRVAVIGFVQRQNSRDSCELPPHVEIIMCLTLNSATECAGSRFQVVVAVCGLAIVLMVAILSPLLDAL